MTTTQIKPTDLIPLIDDHKTCFADAEGRVLGVFFSRGSRKVYARGCPTSLDTSDLKPQQRYSAARKFIAENFRM